MKRRRLLGTLMASIATRHGRVLSLIAPLLASKVSKAAGRSASTSASEATEADWAARSTGPGVLWAHDFRSDAEFHNFHKGRVAPYDGIQTNPVPMPYHATLVPTPFGASRAIRSAARGTHLVRPVPKASVGEIQVWHVADVTKIAPPWDGEYQLNVAAKEYVWVQSCDQSNGTITVRRTKTLAYPAEKTTIGSC